VKDYEDKDIISLMDRVEEQKMVQIMEQNKGDVSNELPDDILNNIKAKTYKKIGVSSMPQPQKKSNLSFKSSAKMWKNLVASLLILALLGITIVGYEPALAKVKHFLQYIPGMGIVLEDEGEAPRYVLEKSIVENIGNGMIEIKGVIIDNDRTIVTISGSNLPIYKDIRFKDIDGLEYKADGYSISSSGAGPSLGKPNIWEGTYVYEGTITNINGLRVVLLDGEIIDLPIPLVKAETYKSYAEMGPTVTVEDLSVTAITTLMDDKLQVNLISPPQAGRKINAYGGNPNVSNDGEVMTLKNINNEEFKISAPGMYSPPLSEFYFDIDGSAEKEYLLSIPFIETVYEANASLSLDIPKEGLVEINEEVELAGYPISFKSVERTDEGHIRIFVDLNYDEKKDNNLIGFRMDKTKVSFSLTEMKPPKRVTGWGYTINEKTRAMEFLDISLPGDADVRKLKLYLHEPVVVKNGPWDLEIALP